MKKAKLNKKYYRQLVGAALSSTWRREFLLDKVVRKFYDSFDTGMTMKEYVEKYGAESLAQDFLNWLKPDGWQALSYGKSNDA